jgi:hypothetical protein
VKAAVVERATPADYVGAFTTSGGERVFADLAARFGHFEGERIVTSDTNRQYVVLGQVEMLRYIQAMIAEG